MTWRTVKIFYNKRLLCHWIKPLTVLPNDLSWFESADGSMRYTFSSATGFLGAVPRKFMPSVGLKEEDFKTAHMHVEDH